MSGYYYYARVFERFSVCGKRGKVVETIRFRTLFSGISSSFRSGGKK